MSRKFWRTGTAIVDNDTVCLTLLVLTALLIRLFLITYFRTYEFAAEWVVGSEVGRLAHSLATGDGFAFDKPSAWRGPVYPFVLSLVFRTFGSFTVSSAIVSLLIVSIVSSLTIIPIYYVAKRLFGQEVAIVSSLFWAFHPASLRYSSWSLAENTFVAFSVSLTVFVILRLRDAPPSAVNSCLAGFLISLSLLTRSIILSFIPFALLWLFLTSQHDRKQRIRQIILITLTMIVTLAPWTVRNYMVFGRLIPVTGNFGYVLWQGNNPYIAMQTGGAYQGVGRPLETLSRHLPREELLVLQSLNDVERSNVLKQQAMEFIWSHPDRYITYTLQRIYLFWTVPARTEAVGIAPTVWWAFNWGLLACVGLGILLSRRRWRETSLLLLLIATYPVANYLTHAERYRFRFPIEGMMFIFASFAVVFILQRFVLKKRQGDVSD